jgi:uncharacterized delta-60 repeat protein
VHARPVSHQRHRYFDVQTSPTRRAGSRISSQFRRLRFESLEDRRLLAVAGDLDPTFGVGGIVTTAFGQYNDVIEDSAIQADGKIVVVGRATNGSADDFAVARYNTDGSLDTSFDGDGKVTTAFDSSIDQAFGVAIQPNGKIVVAGYTFQNSHPSLAVARYNSDGSLDTSFDGDGKVIAPGGAQGYEVAMQSDGKIVVVGTASVGSAREVAVYRFNANGSPDNTFSGDGVQTFYFFFDSFAQDYVNSVAIQADGKIVLAGGTYETNASNNIAVARLNTDGSLDTSFDGDGMVNFFLGNTTDVGGAMALQADGKIVVVGETYRTNKDDDFGVARLNTDGTFDTTFGAGGRLFTTVGQWADSADDVAIQPDGKIVVVGSSQTQFSGTYDVAVVRYNANGSLDTSFSGDGKLTVPVAGLSEYAHAAAIQSDGNIVVAGYGQNGSDTDFRLQRFVGITNPPISPGDYSANSTVDAADYVLWRKTLGKTGIAAYSGADGDGSGSVAQEDFTVWRSHFGATGGPGAGAEERLAPSEALSVQVAAAEPLANSNAVVEPKARASNAAAPVLGSTGRQVPSSVRRRGFAAYERAMRDDALLAWLSLPGGHKAAGVDDGAALEVDACEKAVDDVIGALALELSGVGREV